MCRFFIISMFLSLNSVCIPKLANIRCQEGVFDACKPSFTNS